MPSQAYNDYFDASVQPVKGNPMSTLALFVQTARQMGRDDAAIAADLRSMAETLAPTPQPEPKAPRKRTLREQVAEVMSFGHEDAATNRVFADPPEGL